MNGSSARVGGIRREARSAAVERLEGRRLLSAVTYSAAGDFSFVNNPNGVWSYGDLPSAGAAFAQYPTVGPLGAGIDQVTAWYSTLGNEQLYVGKAANGGAVNEVTVALPPGVLDVHPGEDGQETDVRFTAPAAGTVQIGATFTGVDTSGTTTDAHVLHNGTSLADGLVNGYGATFAPTIPTVTVAKGDTIEFTVGYGSNGTYFSDSTSLAATVTLTSAALSSLTPKVTRSTVAATAVAGGVDKGVVLGTLTAAAATKGAVTVAAYATADGVPADGVLLGSEPIKRLNLKAGKASRFVVPVRSLPAGLGAGQYAVVVQVTDPAGGVATTTAGSLFVATPVVVLSSSTLTDVRPSTVAAGHAARALLTLEDTGNVDAAGTLTITYAVASGQSSASDITPARTLTRAVHIAHGRRLLVPLSITLPTGTPAGAAYLVADVAVTGTAAGTAAVSLATADPFTVG